MADFEAFTAIAETGTSEDIFTAFDGLIQRDVGAIISSCSTFDPTTRQAKRVFTNQPEFFPISGLKDVNPNAWTKCVLDERKTFVANTFADITCAFPDYETIAMLGCASVVNIPVVFKGNFLGTINLLHRAGYYSPARVQAAQGLRIASILAFCALDSESYQIDLAKA